MSELTQTGLYFAPDGVVAIKVHREEGLNFDAFPVPDGWARIIIPKKDYDTCATDADLIRLVLPELQQLAPDIATLAESALPPPSG